MKRLPLLTQVAAVTIVVLAWSGIALGSEIHDAARSGDLEKIKGLLKDQPGLVYRKDKHGDTPLLVAAKFGQQDAAAFLLVHKAKVNAKEKSVRGRGEGVTSESSSVTSLGWAALRGDIGMAELLLTSGADVNAGDNGTPLHHAVLPLRDKPVSAGKEMVELLLAHKAKLNAKDDDGQTPLHTAAAHCNYEAVEALLAHEADLEAKDNDGQTPLHLVAAQNYDISIAKLLLAKGAEINATDKHGDTPLLLAAKYCSGDISMVRFLIAKGADVNIKDKKGYTALTEPKEYHCPKLTELLQEHGGHE